MTLSNLLSDYPWSCTVPQISTQLNSTCNKIQENLEHKSTELKLVSPIP